MIATKIKLIQDDSGSYLSPAVILEQKLISESTSAVDLAGKSLGKEFIRDSCHHDFGPNFKMGDEVSAISSRWSLLPFSRGYEVQLQLYMDSTPVGTMLVKYKEK